jgi:hypothetical protein
MRVLFRNGGRKKEEKSSFSPKTANNSCLPDTGARAINKVIWGLENLNQIHYNFFSVSKLKSDVKELKKCVWGESRG